jgi:hypothetical protein
VLSYRHITQRLKLDSFTPSTGCVNINKTTHKKARYGVKRVGQASRSYWVSTLNSKKHGANQFQKMPYTLCKATTTPLEFDRLDAISKKKM